MSIKKARVAKLEKTMGKYLFFEDLLAHLDGEPLPDGVIEPGRAGWVDSVPEIKSGRAKKVDNSIV